MLYYGLEWHSLESYFQMKSVSAPAAPPSGEIRLYCDGTTLCVRNASGSVCLPSSGTIVTGSGAANRLAYWTGASTLDAVTALTSGRVMFPDTNGLPTGASGFFWDATNSVLGLGSDAAIHGSASNTRVSLERDTTNILEINAHANGGTIFAGIDFYRSQGSHGSPTVLGNNDRVGVIRAKCYDGNSYEDVAGIFFNTGTTGPADGATPGTILFATTPPSSITLTERFRVGQSGEWGIGGATFGSAGSYFRSSGSGAAPVWSTLILPNAATANRLVYATSSNTWGESADLTYDGTDLAIASGKRFRMQSQNRIRYLNSMVSATQTTSQTGITQGVFATVTFDGTDYVDTDALHNPASSNSRLTAALTGKYLVVANVRLLFTGVTTPGTAVARIIANGSTTTVYAQISQDVGGIVSNTINGAAFISLAAGEYIELQVTVTGASGTFDIAEGITGQNRFSMLYIGE